MKIKTLLLLLLGLIHCEIYAQNYGPELLTYNNFGTTDDGVTGVNTTVPLYVLQSWITPPDSVYTQPPTSVYYNNYTQGSTNPPPQNISINPAVTVAPPLTSAQTSYVFGFNETWYSNYYTFLQKDGSNSNVQIPMAPNNGYYAIATSTQGMYNAPTLSAGSAAWHVVYDRYEVNQANPTNYFLIVNGDENPNKVFYQEAVDVTPGHIYRMSADLVRLNIGAGDPNVSFSIGGTTNATTGETTGGTIFNAGILPDNGGQWETYAFDYVTPCGVTSPIQIAFFNNTSVTNGNDLALDNLSLKEILPQITMTTAGDCDNLPVTFTLNAVIGLDTLSKYTISWYRENGTFITSSNLGTNSTYSVSSNDPNYNDSYYYTITTTATSGCALQSPTVAIPDISSNCNIPTITPEFDRITATPGVITAPYNITSNDCDNGACDTLDLQVLYFTILNTNNYLASSLVGTYQPGVPLMITDNQGRTVGVLTLDNDGNLTFLEAPDYPSVTKGGIPEVDFNYAVVDTTTGAIGETYVTIALTQLEYTVEASCVGFPVRIVFDVEAFLTNDFNYSTTPTTPPAPTPPGPGGIVPVGEIDPSLAAYINDAVATRFYLINTNTGITISDEAIENGATNIRRIDVVRTGTLTDGGKIIFELIPGTPGIMSCQLRKKDIYAPTSAGDPILQKFLVQVCPATATWSGLSSDIWQDNNNWVSNGLGAYPTWCTDVTIPGPESVITIPPNPSTGDPGGVSVAVITNFPTLIPGDACKDIVFQMGASVGGIQNLTYRAAYVQYMPPMIQNDTEKWTMITVPLKYIYSADFQPDTIWGVNAFTDIKSYMSYFDMGYLDNNEVNPDGVAGASFGSFSRPFANLKQPLEAGLGFASNVILTGGGGTTFSGTSIYRQQPYNFYFPRYHTFGNAKLFETGPFESYSLTPALYGEAQYAYHYTDNGEWISNYPSNPNYNPFTFAGQRGIVGVKTYDSVWNPNYYINNDSVAYVLSGSVWTAYYKSSGALPSPANYKEPAVNYFTSLVNPLVGQDSRFRFIYEEINGTGQSGLDYNYDASTGEFTLPIGGTGITHIVGNPFMSHLDFDELYNANSSAIKPYYRLWDGTSFYAYTASGFSDPETSVWEGMDGLSTSTSADNTLPAAYRYIPPMQAFFVDTVYATNPLSLNFNTVMSTSIPNANVTQNLSGLTVPVNNELRAKQAVNENLLKLHLKMKGIETVALLASLPKASDHYNPQEDVYKLFSYDKATPEIYTISDKKAIEINAVSQEGEQKLIPLGIKTNQTGPFELRIEGALNFNVYEYVQLRDALSGENYDLKENSSFTFEKTSPENIEGRFYILLSQLPEGIETTKEDVRADDDNQAISIVHENGAIRVYSPVVAIDGFEVYDVSGRILYKDAKISASSYLWNPKLEQGVYLLKVHAGKYSKVQKIKW